MKKIILTFIAMLLAGVNTAWAQSVAEAFDALGESKGQFADVDDAVTAAGEGGTVKLIADIVGNVGISGNFTTTLDLNGHTITNESGSGITLYSSYPGGKTFTIKDSDPEKKGAITIKKKYTGDGCISDSSGRIVVIEGGTYTSDDKALYVSSANGWTIKGGTFNGITNVRSNLTIEGGTFNGKVYAAQGAMDYSTNSTIPSSITINGGTFNGTPNIDSYEESNDITVNGGSFSEEIPTDFLSDADAINVKLTSNGVYSYYTTLQDALDAAEAADIENIVIDLLDDATLDITAWSGTQNPKAIGTANTQTITINGNDHTLTFNQLNSDWNNVATMNDEQTKLILNDMTITNSGHNDGPWNRHDINFNCAVELNNVKSDKALAFKNDATLNSVEITENGDVYAIWVQPNGQDINIDGLTINNNTDGKGRGIKIDDQYVDNPAHVDLDIANAEFNTAKKSAILVKTTGGATITAGENIDITNVAADTENLVWIDEDNAEEYYNVTVEGATIIPEGTETSYVVSLLRGDEIRGYYETLAGAYTSTDYLDGDNFKLHKSTTEAVEFSNEVTIFKNGFTADNVTAADGLSKIETEETIKIQAIVAKLYDGTTEQYFVSLAEAIAAVTDTDTLTLITDATLEENVTSTLSSGESFTLNFNGKKITGGKIALNSGVMVSTDVDFGNGEVSSTTIETRIFSVADEGVVVRMNVDGKNAYKVVTPVDEVTYIDINEKGEETASTATNVIDLAQLSGIVAVDTDQFYYASEDTIIGGLIFLADKTGKLILADGVTLTMNSAVGNNNVKGNLEVYGQEEQTGNLVCNGKSDVAVNMLSYTQKGGNVKSAEGKSAAVNAKTIVVNAGTLDVATNSGSYPALGRDNSEATVTINGGVVTAKGTGTYNTGIKAGDIIITGGQVTAEGGVGMYATNVSTTTLSLKELNDFILSDSYSGTVKIADGVTLYDRDDNYTAYSGTLTNEQKEAIKGHTLVLASILRIDTDTTTVVDLYDTLDDAIGAVENEQFIYLTANVTLTDDIDVPLTAGQEFSLKFGTADIDGNGKHIVIPAEVSVNTDKQTTIFAVPDSLRLTHAIKETQNEDGTYTYTYTTVEAVAYNQQTNIRYATLQGAIDDAASGQTIVLMPAIEKPENTLTKTVTINKSITIEGGDYLVTSVDTTGTLYGPRLDPAFHITGPGSVTLNKVNLVAPYVVPGHDGPGIYDQYTSGSVGILVDNNFNDSLVINYSTITTTGRGIDIQSVGGGFVLNMMHSHITTTDDDPDTAYGEEVDFDPTTQYINSFDGDPYGRGRGINFGNDAVTCVANIQFSDIKGYAYPINIADNSGKLILNMTDCSTWGRDVINNWGDNGAFKLKNITAHGYNNEDVEEPAQGEEPQAQNNEAFAAIVDYKTADLNFYDIESLRVVANVKAADADSTSASENFIDLRGINATVKISGNSGYEIADSLKDRVGFVNNNLSDDDVNVGETDAFKRMIDKSVNNRVYFDDQAKAYFNYWFEILEPFEYKLDDDSVLIRIGIDDEKDYTNLYPVVPLKVNVMLTITVETEDGEEGAPKVFYYEKLQDAFNNELFASDETIERTITIMNNIEMDEDITPNLKRGENFTLTSIKDDEDGETWLYSINPGDYHIFLNPLVTAFYDDMTGNGSDVFAPADSVNTTILGVESVYYTAANVYWAGDVEEIDGMYWLFDELFNYKEDDLNPYFTPGTYTRLEMDINLERNVKLPTGAGMDIIEVDDDDTTGTDTSTEEEETGDETYQYWLDFNITDENPMGYAIYKGDYSIILQLGQEVYTTAPTDIFSSFDPEYSVVYDSVSVEKFNEDSVTVTFLYKYYLLKDGLAITVDPATYCGDRLTPNFTVKKKVTTEEVDPNDDTQTINKDTWVELTKSLTKEEYDQMVDDGEDVSGYDYFWYLVPPVDENDSTTYISAKTYVQALVIEGISFQGIRKADFTILPRDIKDVTVDGNIQPWREEGYTPAQIDSLISLVYECIEHSSDTTLTKYDEETKKGDYRIAVVDSTYIDYNTYAKVITITAVEGGNYTGTLKLDFTILPEGLVDISKCMVVSKAVYNSLKQAPTYDLIEVVYMNGSDKVVLEPEQFEIELHGDSADYVDAKTYSNAMTLRGTTQPGATDTLRFFGTVVADYVIAQRDLADTIFTDDFVEVILEKNKDMEWSGDDLTKMIKIGDSDDSTNNVFLYMKVNDDNYHYALTNDESINKFDYSYTVDPSPMINPGEYRVIFTGRGNFTGMREMTINVLKDINLIVDGIKVPLQIIPDNIALKPSEMKGVVVKDGNKNLIEGVHYEFKVWGTKNYLPFEYTDTDPIVGKGIYDAYIIGKEPYYSDTVIAKFPVIYEYYAYVYDSASPNEPIYNNNPGLGNATGNNSVWFSKPYSFRVTRVKEDNNCEGQVSAINGIHGKNYTAFDPSKEVFEINPLVTVSVGTGTNEQRIKINIVGIEDNALRDLPRIHCLDATKLVGYTPTTLSRTSDGPFNHYPLQSLVYLDGDDYKGTNYIYKTLTEGFRCEELKIYDDTQGNQQTVRTSTGGASWEFRNIYLFTADKVTNTRYFTNGQHYTTCLPYELQMTSDLKAYTLDAASDNIFGFKQYKASKLDRFTPYVLIPSKSGNLLSNAEKTVVYVTPNVNRGFLPLDDNNNRRYDFKTPTGHIMYGTNVYMGWTSTNPVIFDLYIMQSKNTWKKIPATRQSTYNNACILPMRAYIMLPSHPQSNGYVQINPEDVINSGGYPSRELMPAKYIDVDDDATAINDIAENEDWSNAEVYDLQGRKVDTTVNLPKGVYIVNGQKRIKK